MSFCLCYFYTFFVIFLGLDLSTGTRTILTMIGAMLAPLNVSICIMYYPFTVRIADPVLWMDTNPVLNKAKVRFFNCFRFHGQVGSVFLLVGIDIADPKLQIFLFVSLFISIPILFTARLLCFLLATFNIDWNIEFINNTEPKWKEWNMELILESNSEHVAHAWKKIGLLG